jgi:chromosome segregation ATPase
MKSRWPPSLPPRTEGDQTRRKRRKTPRLPQNKRKSRSSPKRASGPPRNASKPSPFASANEEALNRLKAEHSQTLADAEKAATARHEEEKAKLLAEHDAKISEGEAAHGETLDKLRSAEASLERLGEEKAQSEASRDARIAALEKEAGEKGRDIEAAKRTVEELDAKLAAAEANLAATREELREALAGLGSERSKTDKAQSKWNNDKASLERAKDALAAALAQLDEIESRKLD